jgi:hypothetical protein
MTIVAKGPTEHEILRVCQWSSNWTLDGVFHGSLKTTLRISSEEDGSFEVMEGH